MKKENNMDKDLSEIEMAIVKAIDKNGKEYFETKVLPIAVILEDMIRIMMKKGMSLDLACNMLKRILDRVADTLNPEVIKNLPTINKDKCSFEIKLSQNANNTYLYGSILQKYDNHICKGTDYYTIHRREEIGDSEKEQYIFLTKPELQQIADAINEALKVMKDDN